MEAMATRLERWSPMSILARDPMAGMSRGAAVTSIPPFSLAHHTTVALRSVSTADACSRSVRVPAPVDMRGYYLIPRPRHDLLRLPRSARWAVETG